MSDPQQKDDKPPEGGGPKDDANWPEGKSPKVDGLPLGEAEVQRVTLPPEMPVLPVRGLVLFPQVVLPIAVNEERDLRLVNNVVVGNRLMVVVAVKNEKAENPGPDDLYQVGCAVAVLKMMKFPDETTRILVQGLSRVRLDRVTSTSPYLKARSRGWKASSTTTSRRAPWRAASSSSSRSSWTSRRTCPTSSSWRS